MRYICDNPDCRKPFRRAPSTFKRNKSSYHYCCPACATHHYNTSRREQKGTYPTQQLVMLRNIVALKKMFTEV